MRRWLGFWLIGYDWRGVLQENDWLWEKNETLVERLARCEATILTRPATSSVGAHLAEQRASEEWMERKGRGEG